MPEVSINFSWTTLARKYPFSGVRSVPTMDSATWCRTPAVASAGRRLCSEVSKNSSTALSSNEGELARSITTCVPAIASLRPSPVRLFTPVLGEAATTSLPPWRRMGTVFEPIRPVPPMTRIFIPNLLPVVLETGSVLRRSSLPEPLRWDAERPVEARGRVLPRDDHRQLRDGVVVVVSLHAREELVVDVAVRLGDRVGVFERHLLRVAEELALRIVAEGL